MPLRAFWASRSGRVGLGFFGVLVAVSLYALLTYPLDYGRRTWYNPEVWADLPKSVPPAWMPGPHFSHRILEAREPTAAAPGDGQGLFYDFSFYHRGTPPSSLALTVGQVSYHGRPPLLTLSLQRPDGRQVVLYRLVVPGPSPGEGAPFHRYTDSPRRLLLSQEEALLTQVAQFLEREFGLAVRPSDLRGRAEKALFGVPSGEGGALSFQPLPGNYRLGLTALLSHPQDRVGLVRVVLGGTRYGLMGTDGLGRDLAQGLIFGFPVALAIGLITALFTTAIGAALGLWSGFSGGRTDNLIQRFADTVANFPLLPILIFLVYLLGPRLWLVMLLLVVFGWPGLTVLSRSMVLQLRTGPLVEAVRALGASPWRIMFRHIAFQIAPFLLAQLIFFTPGAILAEAALSFLGLGDPSLPTWGQMLEQGFRTGAVYLGYWWWVLPPGLLIVATAMAFVLITLGMEPVVNPRLRGPR